MTYIQNYNQISRKKNFRSLVRDKILDLLSYKNILLSEDKLLQKPRIQFLYLHHFFKDEIERLESLIKWLAEKHTFISYSDAVNKIVNNQIDKPYIVFSSDDGFKNNLDAVKIFDKYNIKACFFLNPLIIGETDYNKIAVYCSKRLNFKPVEFLNWTDVKMMMEHGHEIGSHTNNHVNLAQLTNEEAKEEISISKTILENKLNQEIPHFAFPYGRFIHFDKRSHDLVKETGYTTCATAERGCHINIDKPIKSIDLCIRRDHIILNWKLNHIKYFLINNVKKVKQISPYYPY